MVAARVAEAPRPPRVQSLIVAVDGCGGAGKSTFAARLAGVLDAPVVSTDECASWSHPLDWYPRVIEELLMPLAAGRSATYRRSEWGGGESIEVTVAPAPILVLEGVSSSRRAFDDYLAFRIWIETDRAERLRRGLERDGEHLRDQWLEWMASEDAYVADENPRARADVVVPGDA
jgi:uridine kinase